MTMRKLPLIFVFVASVAAAQDEDFEKGFGASSGISDFEKESAEEDRLKIGGSFASDAYVSWANDRDYFRSLNTVWLYFDATLRNDIRAYIKLRGVADSSSGAAQASSPLPASTSDVEEMKLFFNAEKRVFFTAGRQKIKWGTGKFWNPTDVVNQAPRDLLYSDDRRSGVSILKTHVPAGAANFYLVQSFNGADQLSEIGHSARAELPLGPSEFAFTASKLEGREAVFGADASAGVADFDVYAEYAYSDDVHRWVGGLSYEMNFLDNDTLSLAFEYYHNGDGLTDSALYPLALATGSFVPYQVAQRYAMFMIYAPTPGGWNHTNLSLSNLFNVSDGSALSKLSVAFTLMQDLILEPSVSYHYGDEDGEMRQGDQRFDAATRLLVNF
jgi:hypothetical protein